MTLWKNFSQFCESFFTTRVERKDEEITLFSCEKVQFLQHTY